MPDQLSIQPTGPVHASIRPPGSKSITNRALVCAAMAAGTSQLHGALDSEDTQVMAEALRRLGVRVTRQTTAFELDGCGGRLPSPQAELDLANSGTSIRFLTAILAAGQGTFRLNGNPRMRQRPIGDLVDGLRQLGAELHCENNDNCPPVWLRAHGLRGGDVLVRGDISSQFLSGLLLAAPYAADRVTIHVQGPLVSRPYVDMTVNVMRQFGVAVDVDGTTFAVQGGQSYQARQYMIEPDASAASYFWAAAAVTGGSVTVAGLDREALQGDVRFSDCLQQMGCSVQVGPPGITVTGGQLRGIDVDMNAISDTAQTLAAVALFADGPTRIRGVAHIRHKETDRIEDLARELRKLGAGVDTLPDGLLIRPGPLRGAEVATYDDHRMAMSLAVVGLRVPGVIIQNPACTRKTYPNYFEDLARICRG